MRSRPPKSFTLNVQVPGFWVLLGVIFISFKLAGIGIIANWPWVWVLAPLWVPFAILLVLAVITAIIVSVHQA